MGLILSSCTCNQDEDTDMFELWKATPGKEHLKLTFREAVEASPRESIRPDNSPSTHSPAFFATDPTSFTRASLGFNHLPFELLESDTKNQEASEVTAVAQIKYYCQRILHRKQTSVLVKQRLEEEANLPRITQPPFLFEDGSVYTGEWRGVMRDGQGKLEFPDKTVYSGSWINDEMKGHGTMHYPNGDVYEGCFDDGAPNGMGVMSYADGHRIEGQWRDGLAQGFVVQTFPGDSFYCGFCAEGVRSAFGKLERPPALYVGNWEQNQRFGLGMQLLSDGSRYLGHWASNKMNGFGKFTWKDGRVYEGSWHNNSMHGKGVSKWPDGKVYVGEYMNNKKHGEGRLTYPNGDVYVGGWVNGEKAGKGTMMRSGGEVEEGVWRDGELTPVTEA